MISKSLSTTSFLHCKPIFKTSVLKGFLDEKTALKELPKLQFFQKQLFENVFFLLQKMDVVLRFFTTTVCNSVSYVQFNDFVIQGLLLLIGKFFHFF